MATDRAYHHGDLRAALIARALEVVETQGHEAVSLRAIAEELGVSRGAPYRHFPERDHLLAEVASVGFERLDAFAQDESVRNADRAARVIGAAQQFLGFVRAHPQLFRLMYESGLFQRADAFPHLAAAQRGVYERIHALFAEALAGVPGLDGDGVKARVIAFWSTLFGYATISQAALLQPYMVGGLSADEIEVQIIRTALGPELAAAMHGGREHA
jgi:AcrR family transcriptional regulator